MCPNPRLCRLRNLLQWFDNAAPDASPLQDAVEGLSGVRLSVLRKGRIAKRAVVIPEYSEVDVEIIKNNMRTVGMTREQYFELLDRC